jgi:hypothetical protein
MAKNRSNKKKSNNTANAARRRRVMRAPPMLLDKAARDYARLLADPCGAPLVQGIAPSSSGTIVVRLESDAILFNGAGQTAGAFYWIPGAARAFANAATTDSASFTFPLPNYPVPGATYIGNYASARAISACVQVMYPGSELNRSGVISVGVVGAGALTNILPVSFGGAGGNTTVGNLRTMCQHVYRTPHDVREIRFRPGAGDEQPTDLPGLTATPASLPVAARGRNAFLVTASGLPDAVGVRLRCVCIYELTPVTGLGMVSSVETTRSINTQTQVVQALDARNPHWYEGLAGNVLKAGALAAATGLSYAIGGAETAMNVAVMGKELMW